MVATRRQSKDFESIELPRTTHHKRKRSNDATPATSTAQPPDQPSSKRRKKVKSTAKVDSPPLPNASASAVPSKSRKAKPSEARKATKGKAHEQRPQGKDTVLPKTSVVGVSRTRKFADVDLTKDDNSSDDEPAQQPRTLVSRDADDEDADSRYALAPKRKGKTNRPAPSTVRRTAELKFEEDGVEEVDKAKVAVADASNRASQQGKAHALLPAKPVNGVMATRTGPGVTPRVNAQGKSGAKQKQTVPLPGVSSKIVMFTIAEAIASLSQYKDGTMSVPADVDPQSRQPYEPLQTGEFLSYPVKSKYHLGGLGRFGTNARPSLPFALTVPLSEYSIIQDGRDTSTAELSRRGLGFASALPVRPQAPSVRRSNNYCFTFGKFRGRRMDSVPITYLRSIFNSDEYHADVKLQKAFADLYPKGLYESEAESFTFEKGGFKGKRFDEVPKSYLWGLLRKMNEGDLVGGKKGRGRLEKALEVWEKGQLDLTQD